MVNSTVYSKLLRALRSFTRTNSITLYAIIPYRNLRGLPKHLNGHPRLSEQNLLPQNMVWRTREASRPLGDPTLEGSRTRPDQHFAAQSRPHQTPHHRRGRRWDSHPPDPTPQDGKEGGGFPPTKPHTRKGKEGGGVPINPTRAHTTGGRLPRPFWKGGWGRSA